MACGSCGKRKSKRAAGPVVGAGPKTKIVWYAVGPDGESTGHETLTLARAAARRGGYGWSVESERVRVED